MATMTGPGTGTSLPAVTTSRRTGLALAVAAAVGAALAGAGPAQAAAPAACDEYAAFQVTAAAGGPPLPGDGSDSRNPRDVYVSVSGPARYVALSGVHRPRRPIVFTFVDQDDVVVRQYATTPSDDSGVIRPERNLIPWNYPVGTRLRVNAVIRTRCGGDDVPTPVYVGAINSIP
ncbi:hypothetical protein AAH979_33470 [Plantactinospora sp. ZYX-F-223]|uniref:hypothetical protein n=1 Tax=Plantactinospora sp. ZYX-F-223 TaxID=3144103 RepID=UPI0031FE2017